MKLFCGTHVLDLSQPVVMGILNITPDSFYDGGRFPDADSQLRHVERMLEEGAAIIDIGAISTRPGAPEVTEEDEIRRLIPSLVAIRSHFPGCIISVDTFRPRVARAGAEHGANIINDIYGGRFSEDMIDTVAALNIPYILMHMKGTPSNMQNNPVYADVVAEVGYFFEKQVGKCHEAGVKQVILDPGFGFGKTTEQNFALLSHLGEFRTDNHPLLVGISRKSMINRFLNIKAAEALNGTSVLNTIAILKGANILRVHDVKEAMEAIRLVGMVG